MARDETKSTKPILNAEGVRIGSEIGVTLPIGDTTAHIRFSFWSERICANNPAAIKRTVNLVAEFNDEELNKRLDEYIRQVRRAMGESVDELKKTKKTTAKRTGDPKVSVRDRALSRKGR